MKAIFITSYGSPEVLQVKETQKPQPKSNEILVKIIASSITRADTMMRTGKPYYGRLFIGLTKPKNPISGTGFAGIVEDIGKDVKMFKKGDQVFGESVLGPGTNAEYICVPENGVIALKPENITYEEAAPICDGVLTSINFLTKVVKVESGQKVLINGASGSIGVAAIQLAKYFEAKVTAVCGTANIELVKSLGADFVIDYTKTDFIKTVQKYDIVFDTVGKSSFKKSKRILTESGVYISPVLNIALLFQMLWTSKFSKKKARFSATGLRPVSELNELLREIIVAIKSNQIKMVIDKTYQMEEIAAAHSYIDTGHKRGNIVLSITNN